MTATPDIESPLDSTTREANGPTTTSRVSLWRKMSVALANRPGALLAVGNSAALASERIVKLAIALVITASLGRMLGPVEFGIYSTIASVTTALAVTADLGTSRVIVRELVRRSAPPGVLLGTAFVARLMGGLFTGVVSYLVSVSTIASTGSSVNMIAAGFAVGWLLRSFDVVDYGFQAISHCGYPVAVRSFVMVLMAVVQLGMIYAHSPIWAFAVAFAVESLIASLGLLAIWSYHGVAPIQDWAPSGKLLKQFLRESWPMFAAAFLSTIYYKSDLLIVNRLCDAGEAGLYASASRLYDMMVAPIPMLTVAIFPLLARWYDDPKVSFRNRYVMLTRWMTLSWMVVLGLVVIFSRQVLQLFYGSSFVDASGFLSVNCLSALLMANGFLRSSYLNLASRQQILLWTSMISAGVNVSLNYLLVSSYGAIGAAYAGVITQVISLTLLNLLWSDTRWLTLAHFGIVLRENVRNPVGIESV